MCNLCKETFKQLNNECHAIYLQYSNEIYKWCHISQCFVFIRLCVLGIFLTGKELCRVLTTPLQPATSQPPID